VSGCLITGIGGFLGSHLAEFALAQGWTVSGIYRSDSPNIERIRHEVALFRTDILDGTQFENAAQKVRPDVIFHLAAQSSPSVSWMEPERTFRVNVLGTLNLLEGVRAAGLKAAVVVAGSSAEYGLSQPEEIPIQEDKPLRPASPYGVSKVASSALALLYHRAFEMKAVVVRPFFVIGPRKTSDVCSSFARGIVAVETRKQTSLNVGNLDTVRDFLDTEDAVRALWLLAEKGVPGKTYNVCSGTGHKVGKVLEAFLRLSFRPIPVEHDPALLRTADEPVVVGDNSRLRALGWIPRVPLDDSLSRILGYWRSQAEVSASTSQ
jgi:GDP-4-dehydro-6-deoxy-D-mannose reductase